MRRNVSAFTNKKYDLIIVGGGIFGICTAWDATLRGLSVALLERGDFAHATSANCFKIVHGGIRYLQHADLYRIRESSRERSAFLHIAPHLVSPLPIVIPTYGHGLKGKEILSAGLLLYDLITFDRNRGLKDPQQRIPHGHTLSREECIRLFPGLKREGLTGGVVFYDSQMYNPPRLALSFLKSAMNAGADAANYVEVTDLLRDGDRIFGVKARDVFTGDILEIRGKVVLNAAGPWVERLIQFQTGLSSGLGLSFSRDASFIVARPLIREYALAIQGMTKDPDALLSRGRRHLFIVPWRHHTLIGVWHRVYTGSPDKFTVADEDLQGFLDEVNTVYPEFGLTLKDVSMWNAGLVLFGKNKSGATDLSYGKRSLIVDHAEKARLEGLITLVGVRFTTARGVAATAVDLVFKKLGKRSPKCVTAETPIWGGRIERFNDFARQEVAQRPRNLNAEVMAALLKNHGSEYKAVLKYLDENPEWAESVGESLVIKAEIIHAVREEMVMKLGDVVFRRTDLGSGSHPGEFALKVSADLTASELGWNENRIKSELEDVERVFPHHVHGENYNTDGNKKRAPLREPRFIE